MTLLEIWQAGTQMPFLVRCPNSGQVVVITSYYWPKKLFEGSMADAPVMLTANWQEWQFVREA